MRNWMSLTQFGALEGKSYPTVLKWVHTERLAAVRVGGVWRIGLLEYERYKREGLLPK